MSERQRHSESIVEDPGLKGSWHMRNRRFEQARFDFFRAAVVLFTKIQDTLIARRVLPPSARTIHWINNRLDELVAGNFRDLNRFFLHSGALVPILYTDWGIDRDQYVVAKKLGIRNFQAVQDEIEHRIGDQDLVALHLGPGNGKLMKELSDDTHPTTKKWMQFGIGDRLYFSLEDVFLKFSASNDPEVCQFIKILSLFVTREFRKLLAQSPDLELERVFEIFANASYWVRDHYFSMDSEYVGSEEFEEDSRVSVSPKIKELLDRLLSNHSVRPLYEEIFTPEFVDAIYNDDSEASVDLYKCINVYLNGFIFNTFDQLEKHIPHNTVAFMHGCRSDSHPGDDDFIEALDINLCILRPGGIYISDGVRESYTRILRYDRVYDLIKEDPQVRAFAVVDRQTQRPLSLYAERGISQEHGYHFYPPEALGRMFDLQTVELVPLAVIVERKDLKIENEVRRVILQHVAQGNRDYFRGGMNDEIIRFADEISRHLQEYLAAGQSPSHEVFYRVEDHRVRLRKMFAPTTS